MPSIFYQAREAEWREHIRRNPATISRRGLDAVVIRTPDMVTDGMEGSSYVRRVESIVDMLRSDFTRLDMGINRDFSAVVSDDTVSYRVSEIVGDDENEPTIQFRAARIQ